MDQEKAAVQVWKKQQIPFDYTTVQLAIRWPSAYELNELLFHLNECILKIKVKVKSK